jgi:hypothetical protein
MPWSISPARGMREWDGDGRTFDKRHEARDESGAHVGVVDELAVASTVGVETILLDIEDGRVCTKRQTNVEDAHGVEHR